MSAGFGGNVIMGATMEPYWKTYKGHVSKDQEVFMLRLQVDVERLTNQVATAKEIINAGIDLMTKEQLGQWAGVRSFLEQDADDYDPLTPNKVGAGRTATVTREMIGAAHDVMLAKGDFVLSYSLLERIYLAMEQAR